MRHRRVKRPPRFPRTAFFSGPRTALLHGKRLSSQRKYPDGKGNLLHVLGTGTIKSNAVILAYRPYVFGHGQSFSVFRRTQSAQTFQVCRRIIFFRPHSLERRQTCPTEERLFIRKKNLIPPLRAADKCGGKFIQQRIILPRQTGKTGNIARRARHRFFQRGQNAHTDGIAGKPLVRVGRICAVCNPVFRNIAQNFFLGDG